MVLVVCLDGAGADTLVVLADELATRGMRVVVAGALPQMRRMLERSGAFDRLGTRFGVSSLSTAIEAQTALTITARPDAVVHADPL